MDESAPQEKGFLAALQRVPGWTVPAILLGVPAIMAILSWISSAFYYNVVWQYFWGPIVTDGSEAGELVRGGVRAAAGYNPVNTVAWAILMFVCIFGIAQLLTRYKVPMDAKMILAATAWVITGSVFHVLQDSQLFNQPFEFIFITPPIWLLYGAFGVGSMAIGVYLNYVHRETKSLEMALQKAWMLFGIIVLGYFLLWMRDWEQIRAYANPLYAAAFALVAFIALRMLALRAGRIEPWMCVSTFSIGWFLMAVNQYIQYWLLGDQRWSGKTPSFELDYAIWLVPALAAGTVLLVYLVAKFVASKGKEGARAFMQPINLFIVFSQMMDAFSTAVGVDLQNYIEKHVLSESVRQWAQQGYSAIGWDFAAQHPTFFGFAPVKLIVSLLVVYAIDVSGKEDMEKYPTMMNLVKFAVIMVGIGPGVRNTLRMTIGI